MSEKATCERCEKLQAFKDYVHKRLDDAGVPVDPDSPHKAEGCRIGGRLDVLIGERDQFVAVVVEGKRLPAPELSQDPAFAAFVLGNLEREVGRLRKGFECIGVGDFRQGWLTEAETLRSEAAHGSIAPEYTHWVARVRELVQAMIDAHHAAGLKTQYEADHEVKAEGTAPLAGQRVSLPDVDCDADE